MKNINWFFIAFLICGFSTMKQGIFYFTDGKADFNSDLRNYAVAGQIVFGLALMLWSVWYYKTPFKRSETVDEKV